MSNATLIIDRNYEKYQSLDILAKFYDDVFVQGDGSNHIYFLTQADLDTIGYSIERHPLGACPFYLGRTSFNIDSQGNKLYRWSTTDYNYQLADIQYTANAGGVLIPSVVGYGAGLPFTHDLETFNTFYFEDLEAGNPPTPDGYYELNGLFYPYWNNWPGLDFYGRQKIYHFVGDKVYALRGSRNLVNPPGPGQVDWSSFPEKISAGSFGSFELYWIVDGRKVPFTDILKTITLYRRPKMSSSEPPIYYLPGGVAVTAYWNPKTDQYFYQRSDEEALTNYYINIDNNGDFGRFNSLPNDTFYVNNNLVGNFVQTINRYSLNDDNYVSRISPRFYVQQNIFGGASEVLNSNQYVLNNDVYFDFNYTFKHVFINNGTISVKQYDHTGYYGLGYQIASPAIESSSSEIFQLNKKRLSDNYTMIEETPMDIIVSGSVIRNKNLYYSNGKLDIDLVYQNGSVFHNAITNERIAFSNSQSLRYVNSIMFSYIDNQFGKEYSENIVFTNDQQFDNAPLYDYDFNVTILNNGSYDYYSDNEKDFDGGGLGAITGSGTTSLRNTGNEGNFLMFDGSGTLNSNSINLDTYQTSRANIKAIQNLPSGNGWRNNHLSPLINLDFTPNSGLFERPGDSFHTIQDMVSDGSKLFAVGNRVGIMPKLTVGNSGEYTDKVYRYNSKIAECL